MANENLWHIQEQIFGYLDDETVEICQKVCQSWNATFQLSWFLDRPSHLPSPCHQPAPSARPPSVADQSGDYVEIKLG